MELISLAVFIFCVAMAAGSFLLTSRLLKEHPLPFNRSLFYHVIFMFAFGFYGIWGQFIIVAVAGTRLTPELLTTVSVVSLLLGIPFIVLGWMMMLRFGSESAGSGFKGYAVILFLLCNIGFIAVLGFVSRDKVFSEALPLFKLYYCCAAVIFSLITSFILVRGQSCPFGRTDRRALAVIIVAGAFSQAAVLLLLPHSIWMGLAFVFLLFASTTLLPVYLTYLADLKPGNISDELPLPAGIGDFYKKHDISPREADIIREICNGLSNQEIADKLFISLQTVKDHTSRIYSKTNVRNRMQLMTLVQAIGNGVSG
jgi:DNA-binding CsgD family transcriptional regulator